MPDLTPEQIEIFDGMEEVNRKMVEEMEKNAPRCHMKPMIIDSCDNSYGGETQWWECSVCGHTKDM